MKFKILVLLCIFLAISVEVYAIEQKSETISISSGKKTVTYVKFNINENLELKPALAKDLVAKTDSLSNIAKQKKAVAAINGTFFNAYDKNDLQPQGGIIIDRQPVHLAGGTSAMGINLDNKLVFASAKDIKIKGGINGSKEWPNGWYAWHLNHIPTSPDAIGVFTAKFRSSTLNLPGFKMIVVKNGVVTNINQDQEKIPSDGFVIAYGPNASGAEKFSVGNTVEYYIEYPDVLQNAIHMLSVGPKLVTNGQKSVEISGFKEDKITKNAAQRSFIGISKNQDIVMGTVSNITTQNLAELMVKMGLVEAMNLDGGASSGLYFKGKYVTAPGRDISNALVVVKRDYPRIELNGEEIIFPDPKPFIDEARRTLVPIRFLSNEFGAKIDWNGQTRTVLLTKGDTEIQLTIDRKEALVNGIKKELDTKAQLINGRTFVPLRFITNTFGAHVDYDGKRKMVIIKTSENFNEN